MNKQKVIVYVDGFNFYYGLKGDPKWKRYYWLDIVKLENCDIAIVVSADSDMIPSVELAKQAGQKVFIYFPPNHYSSNLAALANGHPIQLSKYESRFRQSLLPDVVHLKEKNFDLSIPEKWKKLKTQ